MSEANHHPADSVSAPEVSPATPLSPADVRRMPIIEVIRRKIGAAARAAESEAAPLPDEIAERRGVITGRTHDEVVQDTLFMRDRRLKQRRRAAHILGPGAVFGRYN